MQRADAERGSNSNRQISPPVRVGNFTPTDPADQEYATFPWDILITPAVRGPYRHSMRYVATPSLILYWERYDTPVGVRGLTPANHLSLALPVRPSPNSLYWNGPQGEPGVLCALPREVSAFLGKGHEHLMLLADRELVHRHLNEAQWKILERADRDHVLPTSPRQINYLRSWVQRVLRQLRACADTLAYPAALKALEEDYLRCLCVAVDTTADSSRKRLNSSLRELAIKRALDYLRSADDAMPTVPGLCKAINVSQRTLEYAFRETFGLSPLGYLRLQRLHAVRRHLMVENRGQTTVAAIACEHGFYELGRFAAVYAKIFGELPSETLAQHFLTSRQLFLPGPMAG